jgi:uncharacterized protein with HEPN domain
LVRPAPGPLRGDPPLSDESRIADVLERVDRIVRATVGGREAFLRSELIQDAVIRNLEVIGEAAKNVGPETRKKFPDVPWRAMARFRDLAIHPYGRILSDEVWEIVAKDLTEIRRALAQGGVRHSRKPGRRVRRASARA